MLRLYRALEELSARIFHLIKTHNRCPLPAAAGLPYDSPAKHLCGNFRRQIAVKSEITRFPLLPLAPPIENRVRLIFG